MGKDYYQLLGVDRNASDAEIKKGEYWLIIDAPAAALRGRTSQVSKFGLHH